MKPSLQKKRAGVMWLAVVVCLGLSLLWADHGWTDSGLSLKLYTRQESHKFPANQEIPIIGVIKNETKWPLNLDLGISQLEIERYFIAKDPQGVRHTPPFQEIQASDMPPPSSWAGYETVPAEVLPPGWERSVDILDLRKLFPVMERLSGWYTIEAEVPYHRYGWTVTEEGSDRLLGIIDKNAKDGTLKSNKLRIYVAPARARGGRMKIRVEDVRTPEQTARSNVSIRIYKQSDLQTESLEDAWEKLEPITNGNTGLGGWVTLPLGGSCLAEPEAGDAYVAIAQYKGEYKEAYLENGAEGWQTECGGLLTRYILFGQVPQEFAVFGLDSVLTRNNTRIVSGHLGAQAQCVSCVVPGFEVALQDTWVATGYQIKGNRVQILSGSVWDVIYNEYDVTGQIRGEPIMGLDLPVWVGLPDLFLLPSEFEPGNESHTVASQDTLTLNAGQYRDVTVGSHATLYLTGGVYHFRDIYLGSHAKVICNAPVEIRIDGRMESGSAKAAYLGPETGSEIGPEDVVVYVNGPGGVLFGQGHTILANIYAKNGTFETGEGCVLTGSFIANDVIIGLKNVVNYAGAFSTGAPPPANSPPTAVFSYTPDDLTATFIDESTDSDGTVTSWSWDFGDGGTSSLKDPSHTYTATGTYAVTLTVTDDDDATNAATQNVTVPGSAPVITLEATSRIDGKKYYVDLAWSGTTVTSVVIYRNDEIITTTANDGSYTDSLGKNPIWPWSYIYKVCEESGDTCSDSVDAEAP